MPYLDPAEWLRNPAIRSLPPAARGALVDLMCVAEGSPQRGYLLRPDGRPLSLRALAQLLGCSPWQLRRILKRLLAEGIITWKYEGLYYDLPGPEAATPPSPPPPRAGELIDWARVQFPEGADTPAVRQAIIDWLRHRTSIGKPYRQPVRQISSLLKIFGADLPKAVEYSIAQGYEGCIRPKEKSDDHQPQHPRSQRARSTGPGQRHVADAARDRWAAAQARQGDR